MRLVTSILLVGSMLAFVACGDNKPDPNTSNNAKPEPSASTSTVASAETPKEEPKKEEPKKEEPKPAPKKTAKEIITADGAVFAFSLADSADAKKMVDEENHGHQDRPKQSAVIGRVSGQHRVTVE
jgi:outer membrane biosynthesis protein TonB